MYSTPRKTKFITNALHCRVSNLSELVTLKFESIEEGYVTVTIRVMICFEIALEAIFKRPVYSLHAGIKLRDGMDYGENMWIV
ncbi:hypothetical protein V6N13_090048 [Hibiscus sabdariffa]